MPKLHPVGPPAVATAPQASVDAAPQASVNAAPQAATPADVVDLAVLHAAAFPGPAAWGVDAIGLLLAMPGAFGLWLPDRGFVLARGIAGEAEVLTLAVAPLTWRQGIGTRLLSAAMAKAAAWGARAMFLEVAADNAAALALYHRTGFTRAGRRRRYYADGQDALVLRRDLAAD